MRPVPSLGKHTPFVDGKYPGPEPALLLSISHSGEAGCGREEESGSRKKEDRSPWEQKAEVTKIDVFSRSDEVSARDGRVPRDDGCTLRIHP